MALLFLFSLAFILLASLYLVSLFKPATKIAAVVGWYLLGFSLVVLSELVGHFFSWLNKPWFILLIQGVLLAVSYLIWRLFKRPKLGGVLFESNFDDTLAQWGNAWEGRPENILLTFFAVVMYGYAFFLGWKVPPNTYDSITTHVTRVAYWMQHGNLLPWNSPRYTQLSYPVNAQLQMLWTGQFLHSDRLFFMTQYLGGLSAILCVIGIARLLKFTRAQSLFAGLMFALFPLVWMQSSTTQNDLVAAGIFLPVLYFFFLGIERRQTSMLLLSGLALGLSIGTKQTLLFYLPGLALLVLLVWLRQRSAATRPILTWAAASLVSFALLSSFIYIQNWVYFGHPAAPPEAMETAVGGTEVEQALGNISYNSIRLLYSSIDNSGLPYPYGIYFTVAKDRTLGNLLRLLNPNLESSLYCAPGHSFSLSAGNVLSEDSAWFGPLGGVLLLVCGIYQLVKGIRHRDPWRTGLIMIAFTFLLVDAWLRPGWDPYQGRYFIPAAAIVSPALAEMIKQGKASRVLTLVCAVIAMGILTYSAIVNPGKWALVEEPQVNLLNENIAKIFELSWVEGATLQNQDARPYAITVDEQVSPDATIGWYANHIIEYPLFGKHFTRTVIPIYPHERLFDPVWLAENKLQFILVDANLLGDTFPEGYVEVDSAYNWVLLERW